jgi:hypothetical protein
MSWPRLSANAATLLVDVLLAGCAAGANPQAGRASANGVAVGFWLGLWPGVIAPVTFVISLFTDTVNIYEVHNNRNWYNLGFFLGFGTCPEAAPLAQGHDGNPPALPHRPGVQPVSFHAVADTVLRRKGRIGDAAAIRRATAGRRVARLSGLLGAGSIEAFRWGGRGCRERGW